MKVMLLLSMTFISSCSLVQKVSDRATIPARYELADDLATVMKHPATWGLSLQSYDVPTDHGNHLSALMVRRSSNDKATDSRGNLLGRRHVVSKSTVVLFHGINARKEQMLGLCQWYIAAGFQCVVYDSRGHGDSSPARATYGRLEVEDLKKVLQQTKRQFGDLGKLVFHGNSMGGAVALQSAPHVPNLKAVVATATFANLYDTMKYQASQRHLTPLLPIVRRQIVADADFDPREIRPANQIKGSGIPVLLIHGSDDRVIPISVAKEAQSIIGYEQCRLITVQGAGHNDVVSYGGNALMQCMVTWVMDQL